MTIPVRTDNDCAVTLCCDTRFFPYALFVCRQIAFHCPIRQFDILIVTQDDLVLPDWAAALGVKVHKMGAMDPAAEAARYHGSLAPMVRIMLAHELGHRYRRFLYVDSDVYFEGGDLERLMQVNLGPHAIAAAKDMMILHDAGHHMVDMKSMGIPRFNYFNSGVMVIDTKAFKEQDIAKRGWAFAAAHAGAKFLGDQSILNGVLQGSYAELAPCWNWCSSNTHPIITMTYPVHFRHFIGVSKPFGASKRFLEARFRRAYEDFFRIYMPELLATLPPQRSTAPMATVLLSRYFMIHLKGQKALAAELARFSDAWDVKV